MAHTSPLRPQSPIVKNTPVQWAVLRHSVSINTLTLVACPLASITVSVEAPSPSGVQFNTLRRLVLGKGSPFAISR